MDFENEIRNVIEAILTQDAEKNAAAVSALKNAINQSPYNFHDPNVYDTVLMYPIRQITIWALRIKLVKRLLCI